MIGFEVIAKEREPKTAAALKAAMATSAVAAEATKQRTDVPLKARFFRHIAIGEPLVRAMAGLPPLRGGCGVSTVRVTPRGTTQPCVYWPESGEPLADLISPGANILSSTPFEQARTLPQTCNLCEFRESCHGGCAGRRRLQGALLEPDSYCPIIRGQRPTLAIRMAADRDLPKLSSSCTTVVIAR